MSLQLPIIAAPHLGPARWGWDASIAAYACDHYSARSGTARWAADPRGSSRRAGYLGATSRLHRRRQRLILVIRRSAAAVWTPSPIYFASATILRNLMMRNGRSPRPAPYRRKKTGRNPAGSGRRSAREPVPGSAGPGRPRASRGIFLGKKAHDRAGFIRIRLRCLILLRMQGRRTTRGASLSPDKCRPSKKPVLFDQVPDHSGPGRQVRMCRVVPVGTACERWHRLGRRPQLRASLGENRWQVANLPWS